MNFAQKQQSTALIPLTCCNKFALNKLFQHFNFSKLAIRRVRDRGPPGKSRHEKDHTEVEAITKLLYGLPHASAFPEAPYLMLPK